jgi:hypothetical protein
VSSSSKTPVYLILGAPGSGRREVLADLIEAGLDESDRPAVMLEAGEAADPADARLPRLTRWTWQGEFIDGALPPESGPVFFVTAGRANPVDQIEVFKAWIEAQGGELARVICVVHCALAEKHPALLAWYDACAHFSDVVLLNRREGVANKWVSDFIKQQGAALRCLKKTVAVLHGAGKRAAPVTKKFRLHQRLGNRAAVHPNKGHGRAWAKGVNIAGGNTPGWPGSVQGIAQQEYNPS